MPNMSKKYKGFSKLPEEVQQRMDPEAAMKYMEGGAVKKYMGGLRLAQRKPVSWLLRRMGGGQYRRFGTRRYCREPWLCLRC